MPLYEYQCDTCAHRFEVIQKFSDAPVDVCPKCGDAVRKLLSSPAIQFKGTGWYITDYARSGKTEGGKTEGGTSEGGKTEGGKTEGKTDGGKTDGGKAGDKAAASPTSSETKTESKTETKSDTKGDSKA